jgi:hypothetical protein
MLRAGQLLPKKVRPLADLPANLATPQFQYLAIPGSREIAQTKTGCRGLFDMP